MEKTVLILNGLGCASCAAKIEDRSKKLSGVNNLTLDFSRSKLSFEHERQHKDVLIKEIEKIVKTLEPDVTVLSEEQLKAQKNSQKQSAHNIPELIRLAVSLMLFFSGLLTAQFPSVQIGLLLSAYLLSGYHVLWTSFKNITRGDIFDENFLMSLATFGALAIGEYPEAVAVMVFYEIGEYFQDLAVNKSKHAITALMDIRPDSATVNRNGFWMTVSPEDVQVGEVILVKPGERMPLDGIVTDGSSSIDVSALTGESVPDYVSFGGEVLSGSVVLNGSLQVKTTSIFSESTVSRILSLVENATAHKSPTENFITKFAKYYTPAVVGIAAALVAVPTLLLGTEVFNEWLYRSLIFLVISCPCALVVSVPLGFFSGIGNASKRGILVKGGNYLEALTEVDTIVFDKTGTLTEGKFEVFKIHVVEDTETSKSNLIKYAALAEYNSNHPIAKSILAYAHASIDPKDILKVEEVSGHGLIVETPYGTISAGNNKLMNRQKIHYTEHPSIHTQIHIALDHQYLGSLEVRDKIKADAPQTIAHLKQLGYRLLMLTGDKEQVASEVAVQLGMDEVYSELLPQDKYNLVQTELSKGNKVAFVGDGINDAPVLALSTVGISMGAIGSDVAIEASDVVLMTDEPSNIPAAIEISKKTKRIVTQNIYFALGTKLLIMLLGAFGLSTMWMAIFADVGVALIAVLNSTRILAYHPPHLNNSLNIHS